MFRLVPRLTNIIMILVSRYTVLVKFQNLSYNTCNMVVKIFYGIMGIIWVCD